jgi:hypothetical protein
MQALRAVFRLPVEQLPDLNERVEKLLAATLQTSTGSPVISPDGA